MAEKRMVGDYIVIYSMCIGKKEVAFCENAKAAKGERYLCCGIETASIFERYTDVLVSDSYAEIAQAYGERIAREAKMVIAETEKEYDQIGVSEELTQADCDPIAWEDSLEKKIIVINGANLRPEYRRATYQIMLCTGGFGAQPKAKGRLCFCTSLYDGRKTSCYRSDIIGVIEPDNLPDWAKKGLENVMKEKQGG